MATVVGASSNLFGITTELLSLVTQRVSSVQRVDKKEGMNKDGDVTAVAYYNPTTEVTIEGLGDSALVLAATVTATGIPSAGGTFYAEEVTKDFSNEEFVKSSVKGIAFAAM